MEIFEYGDEIEFLRFETSPTHAVMRGFARQERVGGDNQAIAFCFRPIDECLGIRVF